jgi:hypothetical protein
LPLLDLFLVTLWLVLFVLWISLVLRVFADIFRSKDLSGAAKALWILFVIALPLLGVLVYLISRGDSMVERGLRELESREAATQDYIRRAAGSTSTADELTKLVALRDGGVLTDAEFAAQKAALLG